jgi:serine/threonine-protein kinase
MSPEQARGKPLDRRTDLWSFGCVLYEMLTACRVFEGETVTDVLSAVISREPDRELLPAATPPALRRLLERCLAKDARERLADAASARLEIVDALRELKEPATASATGPDDRAPDRPAGSKLPWIVAAASLLMAIAVWVLGTGADTGRDRSGPAVVGIEALTDQPGPEFMPALSPDGRYLAYVARDGKDFDIFLVRVGGENPQNLTADHDGADLAPAFSPDGESIAFASDREGGGLFVMGATGESPRRVAEEGTHPDWSPDGKRIVAATEQVENPYIRNIRSRVFVVDLETGAARDLPVGEDGVGPRWSPDGARIAYWNEIEGRRDLWTIPAEGGEPVRVTDDAYTDWEPSWAEDGGALYFHSDRGGSADLWRIPIDPDTGAPAGEPTPLTIGVTPLWESSISADGTRLVATVRDATSAVLAYPFDPEAVRAVGEPTTVLDVGTRLLQPDLSPDGRTLVYRTGRPREIITTFDLETGVRRRLLDDGFRNRGPAWSPDGRWVAIYSNRSGKYEVWLMRAEGTDLHRIFDGSAADPVWSPDGERLAVGANMGEATAILGRPPAAGEQASWVEAEDRLADFDPMTWSPDGRFLVGSSGYPYRLAVHDLATGERLDADVALDSDATAAWLPDGERFVFWGEDEQAVLVWNVRTAECRPVPGVAPVRGDLMISPDARTLYVMEARSDGAVWMLTLDAGAAR